MAARTEVVQCSPTSFVRTRRVSCPQVTVRASRSGQALDTSVALTSAPGDRPNVITRADVLDAMAENMWIVSVQDRYALLRQQLHQLSLFARRRF